VDEPVSSPEKDKRRGEEVGLGRRMDRQLHAACVSSRYSMIANDSNRIGPSPSIKAGSAIIGLTARYAASRCAPFMADEIRIEHTRRVFGE
jgi:hypothetical protein